MLFSSRNHAIGMAHFRMAGGLKSLVFLMLGYLVVVGILFSAVIYNTQPQYRQQVLLMVATLFVVTEGFGIVVMGAMRVAGSIRLDLTTNMIESHRQMPVSAAQAVFDYLTGTTIHVAAVIGLHMTALSILAGVLGFDFEAYVLSQIVLIVFSLFIWSFSAMGALMFRQAVPVIVLLFIFGSCGSMFLHGWGLLPGFSLLTAPFLGETIFHFVPRVGLGAGLHKAYPVALSAQAILGALFFIGACRRYRGAYLSTFNVPMGWVLLATWGALSAASIALWPDLRSLGTDLPQPSREQQIVAALGVAALVLIVPVHALVAWEGRHGLSRGKFVGALLVMVLCAAFVLPVADFDAVLWLLTLLVLAGHALTTFAGLRICRRMSPMTTGIAMIVLLGVLWFAPLLAEMVRWYFQPPDTDAGGTFTLLGALSPMGALLTAWTQGPDSALAAWLGTLCQLIVASLLLLLAYRRQKPAPPAQAPPAGSTVTMPPPQSAPT